MFLRLLLVVGLLFITAALQAQTTHQDSLRVVAITHDSTRVMQWTKLGLDIIYGRTGSYREALTYLERAEAEAKETGYPLLVTHVIQQRGELEWVAGHWPEAMALFQQAERSYAELVAEKKRGSASIRYFVLLTKLRIGQVQTDNKDFGPARKSLMDALHYARDQRLLGTKEQRLVASIYNSLSILEGKLKNQEKSLAYADTAALRSRAAGDEDTYFVSLLNTAITRKNMKQYATAIEQYEACADYFARQKDNFGLAMVYANMPRALLGLKRYDEGIAYAKKAIAMANQTADRVAIQSDVHQALSELYEAQGNIQLAFEAFKLSKAQQDTLFTKDKERQMQELEAKYEAEKKEAQIQELQVKSEQRTWQLAGLGGGAVVLSLLLGLSLYQSKRLREGSKRIVRQKQQLQLLMKELHHRAKNNLAIVSGLLELQANRTEDKHTKQAFREGQQRINAMALIHQRLYQANEITAIDLREYISNLVQSLMKTYGQTASSLDLNLSLQADAVEADVAVPLGLIINEVLTNAFKYAFKQVSRPFLSVTLEIQENRLLLQIADNGPGVDLADWNSPKGSFGKQLIRSLSDQLDAELTVMNIKGTYVRLDVPIAAPVGELVPQ
ncbi:sensor histidine kinase [Fibrella aquatica]|jgi:two-component sensor histidine kinase|uniref:sensor histidine kinase n=1 Tax=Fibrella aquatica TaxID=3242487 RepID=UPI0035204930